MAVDKELKDRLDMIDNLRDEYKSSLFSNIVVFPDGAGVKVLSADAYGFNGELEGITEISF